MNVLPKPHRSLSDLRNFAFGAPVALLGTAFMLFLIDLNGRLAVAA